MHPICVTSFVTRRLKQETLPTLGHTTELVGDVHCPRQCRVLLPGCERIQLIVSHCERVGGYSSYRLEFPNINIYICLSVTQVGFTVKLLKSVTRRNACTLAKICAKELTRMS